MRTEKEVVSLFENLPEPEKNFIVNYILSKMINPSPGTPGPGTPGPGKPGSGMPKPGAPGSGRSFKFKKSDKIKFKQFPSLLPIKKIDCNDYKNETVRFARFCAGVANTFSYMVKKC